MDASTILAIFALLVAILGYPINYYFSRKVAIGQIRSSLTEQEKQQQKRAWSLVLNRIEEFENIFSNTVPLITGNPYDGKNHAAANAHMLEIDEMVRNTGIPSRLSASIDSLWSTGIQRTAANGPLLDKLTSVQSQICLGSSKSRLLTPSTLFVITDKDMKTLLKSQCDNLSDSV